MGTLAATPDPVVLSIPGEGGHLVIETSAPAEGHPVLASNGAIFPLPLVTEHAEIRGEGALQLLVVPGSYSLCSGQAAMTALLSGLPYTQLCQTVSVGAGESVRVGEAPELAPTP